MVVHAVPRAHTPVAQREPPSESYTKGMATATADRPKVGGVLQQDSLESSCQEFAPC